MTGHSNSPKIEAFIKQVNGTILIKPFQADALKNAIDYLERSTPRSTPAVVSARPTQ
jgi:hypothetical protein